MSLIKYEVIDDNNKAYFIFIESSRQDNLGGQKIAAHGQGAVIIKLGEELDAVKAVAKKVYSSLKELAPSTLEIEFGVELGGRAGVPLVTEGSAKANFKVKLVWGK